MPGKADGALAKGLVEEPRRNNAQAALTYIYK